MSTDALFERLFHGLDHKFEPGHTYLVKNPSQARKIYSELVGNGTKGLYISRDYPDHLKEQGIEDSKWIATALGNVDPLGIDTLTNKIL